MTWNTVFQMLVIFLCSLGGGSAIVIGVTKWVSEILTSKIKTAIETKYQKELEKYKAELADSTAKLNSMLQNTVYISQRQYDLEIDIYKKVWKSLVDLVGCLKSVEDFKTINGNFDNEKGFLERKKENYEKITEESSLYRELIEANAPFYQAGVYNLLKDIDDEAAKVSEIFKRYMDRIALLDEVDESILNTVCSNIESKKDCLIDEVREYLKSLKCM